MLEKEKIGKRIAFYRKERGITQKELATIEKADVIYVMESGRIREKGRHSELMEQGGIYKRLVELSGRHVSPEASLFS